MNGTADLPPDDDDLAAAAAESLRRHERVKKILDDALEHACSAAMAQQLSGDDAAERYGTLMWGVLEAGLDNDDRIEAIAILLEPLAEMRAGDLLRDFYGRLARVPEAPHPLGREEGSSVRP